MKENQIESCKIKKGVFAEVMLKLKLSSCQKPVLLPHASSPSTQSSDITAYLPVEQGLN